MFDKESITLDDIKSESTNGLDYIQKNEAYMQTYNDYQPDEEKLKKIREILSAKNESLTLKAFGATWCKDCVIQVPRMVKIAEALEKDIFYISITGEIKVKPPYDRKPGELIWKSPPSPSESIDKRFDMFHIPAIFLFKKDGTCIGKIDEKPEHTPSLEGDIIHYLENI